MKNETPETYDLLYYDFYLGVAGSHRSTWVKKEVKQHGRDLADATRRFLNTEKLILHGQMWRIREVIARHKFKQASVNYLHYKEIRRWTAEEFINELFGENLDTELTDVDVHRFFLKK